MPSLIPSYTPPLRAVGTIRFRPDAKASYNAYEATTDAGTTLVYCSPIIHAFLPVLDATRAQLTRACA